MAKGREQSPDQTGRNFMVGIGVGTIAGAAGASVDWRVASRQVARLIAGRTGQHNRDLRWHNPEYTTLPPDTPSSDDPWLHYGKDPGAWPVLHRTWKQAAGLVVARQVYDPMLKGLGENAQPAFAFQDRNNNVRIGTAYPEDDPHFYGQTNDGENYIVAAKLGNRGLSAMLGAYLPDTDQFVGVPTQGTRVEFLSDLLQQHQRATWV